MKLYVNFYFILMKTLSIQFGQKLSRGRVVDIHIALVENGNFKEFRLLRGTSEGLFLE